MYILSTVIVLHACICSQNTRGINVKFISTCTACIANDVLIYIWYTVAHDTSHVYTGHPIFMMCLFHNCNQVSFLKLGKIAMHSHFST